MPISARGKLRQEQALSCSEKSHYEWLWQEPRNPDPRLSAASSCPSCPTQGPFGIEPLALAGEEWGLAGGWPRLD